MKPRQQEWVTTVAGPLLEPGERIELTSLATVGTVSLKRKLATAAVAGVLSGGMLTATVQPRGFFLALTSSRVLLFPKGLSGRPEKKPAVILPRRALRAGEVKKGLLTAAFEMSVEGQDTGLKFTFPLVTRTDAPLVAAALGG